MAVAGIPKAALTENQDLPLVGKLTVGEVQALHCFRLEKKIPVATFISWVSKLTGISENEIPHSALMNKVSRDNKKLSTLRGETLKNARSVQFHIPVQTCARSSTESDEVYKPIAESLAGEVHSLTKELHHSNVLLEDRRERVAVLRESEKQLRKKMKLRSTNLKAQLKS